MKKRKFAVFLYVALATTLAMFDGTLLNAQTAPTIAGWNVAFTYSGNTYTYIFTKTTGDKISFVELLLPHDLQVTQSSIRILLDGAIQMPFELIPAPTGDGSTGFGIGLTNYDLIKIKSDNARSFPPSRFTLALTFDPAPVPQPGFILGVLPSVMLVKTGNGQVWGSGTIDTLAFVPVPPPPPIGIDSEYLSIEGHPGFLMEVRKDPYGSLTEICLVDAETRQVVNGCCTTGGGELLCVVGTETVTLNLGDLGSSVILCTGGTPDSPSNCNYLEWASETEAKSGDSSCGWKLIYNKYAYVCTP